MCIPVRAPDNSPSRQVAPGTARPRFSRASCLRTEGELSQVTSEYTSNVLVNFRQNTPIFYMILHFYALIELQNTHRWDLFDWNHFLNENNTVYVSHFPAPRSQELPNRQAPIWARPQDFLGKLLLIFRFRMHLADFIYGSCVYY